MWEKYEWFIRRAAGLGKAADEHEDPDRYEHIHFHCDVLIAGGGLSVSYFSIYSWFSWS